MSDCETVGPYASCFAEFANSYRSTKLTELPVIDRGSQLRLVTRADLDGLACSVIITSNEKIDEIKLIHPQEITDRTVEIFDTDILANVPYHPNCGKWFDHHLQTDNNPKPPPDFDGVFGYAPSAARLVFDYYGGEEKMPHLVALVKETDRLDSARLVPKDVSDPQGFIQLGFTIDGRTGLGTFQAYFHLLNTLLKTEPIEEILKHPKVQERVAQIRADDADFKAALEAHSQQDGNVIFTDFRDVETVPKGNRFLIYTLYPEANVSLRVHWGPGKQFVVAAIGHSIFNRTCNTNVGELCARFSGGGHKGAGTTPLRVDDPQAAIDEIITELKTNG